MTFAPACWLLPETSRRRPDPTFSSGASRKKAPPRTWLRSPRQSCWASEALQYHWKTCWPAPPAARQRLLFWLTICSVPPPADTTFQRWLAPPWPSHWMTPAPAAVADVEHHVVAGHAGADGHAGEGLRVRRGGDGGEAGRGEDDGDEAGEGGAVHGPKPMALFRCDPRRLAGRVPVI